MSDGAGKDTSLPFRLLILSVTRAKHIRAEAIFDNVCLVISSFDSFVVVSYGTCLISNLFGIRSSRLVIQNVLRRRRGRSSQGIMIQYHQEGLDLAAQQAY
jgi:hypothetical protein